MSRNLTVTNPFGGYQIGAVIADQTEAKAILASENASNVVKVEGVDAPKAETQNQPQQSGDNQ